MSRIKSVITIYQGVHITYFTHTVLYSDESSIQVLGIQMVTVLCFSSSFVGPKESLAEFNLKVKKLVNQDFQTGQHSCSICQKVFSRIAKAMDHIKSKHLVFLTQNVLKILIAFLL